jgi:hypothetical protein
VPADGPPISRTFLASSARRIVSNPGAKSDAQLSSDFWVFQIRFVIEFCQRTGDISKKEGLAVADTKHPWRDIYSVAAWNKILKLTNHADQSDFALSGITRHIGQYHAIRKDVMETLPARRQSLLRLGQNCIDFLSVRGISTDKAGKKKYDDRAKAGNEYIKEIGPWLMSLAGRSIKKYDYLKILEDFERDHKNAEHSRSAASFLAYLNEVQKRRETDTNMHLTAGNRMERIDPLHRGGAELEFFGDNYIKATTNPLSKALVQWLDDDSTIQHHSFLPVAGEKCYLSG